MELYSEKKITPILVEAEGYEGVRRIAETVAGDFEKITGVRPACISEENIHEKDIHEKDIRAVIFCATIGKSRLLEELEQTGKIDLSALKEKREVFQIKVVEQPVPELEQALVICGSDKRGTIYGMFTLSEYIGVYPLCFWGDVQPIKRDRIVVGKDIEQVSQEPSVRYRGFFINDEWPCFGSWVNEHFGGFNAKAYKEVFEFLLRMKGNYLWPAMWSASFPLDGPGSANEELADIYGVVMGYSHHEPCLRASEEWDKVKGADSEYGSEWNFYTNEQGLLRYWEDALKRSGKYENIITIGMRGERDTSMLGENATIAENVNLLKDIIRKQRKLIAENVNKNVDEVPQLLALYKEVEQYFYGIHNGRDAVEGLKEYSELDGVICMLCEDNFGHMRTLPTEDIRERKGGFGMYYHLDYHGGPISYEWVDSTPLSQIWEQMSMAYEYGIKDAWIVNVGDLKFHEVPLTYFMALAYDYGKWGYGNMESYKEYAAKWARENFQGVSAELQKDIVDVFTSYINMNNMRRPEALHEEVYHPYNYGETDQMIRRATEVEEKSLAVIRKLAEAERDAYYSMVHYPAIASMNLLKLHLYAGKNIHYARQGKKAANTYGELVKECIRKDRELIDEFAAFKDGKWNGMQLAQHIGFTKWNEDGYRYPMICSVEPVHKPRLVVSRSDSGETAYKNYGQPMVIIIDDFLYAKPDSVILEIANDGIGQVHYHISAQNGEIPEWLSLSSKEGDVEEQEYVTIRCIRKKMTSEKQTVRLLVEDGDSCIAVEVSAKKLHTEGLPKMTFLPFKDAIVIGAEHFAENKPVSRGGFAVMSGYGKYNAGVKVFPSTAVFGREEAKPELTYRFLIEEAGDYVVEILTAPTNAVVYKQSVTLMLDNHLGKRAVVEVIPSDFRAGESGDERWAEGVLNQIRVSSVIVPFEKGVQKLTIGAMEAGIVLERIRIYREDIQQKKSYLGQEESMWVD